MCGLQSELYWCTYFGHYLIANYVFTSRLNISMACDSLCMPLCKQRDRLILTPSMSIG